MPQNISSTKVLLHPSENSLQPEQSSTAARPVDSFADRLMDDLFADVEGLLDGSVAPPPVPIRPELQQPKLDVATLPRVQELVAPPSLPQWNLQPQAQDSLSVPEIHELVHGKAKPSQWGQGFQRFLVLALVTSAIAALGVWLTNRGSFSRILAGTQPASAVATAAQVPQVNKQQQFAEYMQRSLENIDRKAATGKTGLPPAPFNSNLPIAPVADGKAAVKSGTPLPKTPVVINLPAAPAAPPASVTVNDPARRELNQLLSRLSTVLEKLYPAMNRSQQAVAQPPVVKANMVTEPLRSVRGVAIANDPTQSAVLIETNGITQRYYVGESIGSSGWSVVDISSNYISVRRNGEVRSIAVGESLK